MTTLEYATEYLRAGISVMPISRDGRKRPESGLLPKVDGRASWNPLRVTPPSEAESRRWWGGAKPAGIAAICGAVSGGLEVLDFDARAAELFPVWLHAVEEQCSGLTSRLCVVRTPRKPAGWHVWLRCPGITDGNQKLAEDEGAPSDARTLIETRGEGGYALLPGSPAECHETGGLYQFSRMPLWELQPITAEEREVLLDCARALSVASFQPTPFRGSAVGGADPRPGDDFDQRGPDWSEILLGHGWQLAGGGASGERRWRRPGKRFGWSATTGNVVGKDGCELLHVFTSSAAPFEPGKNYGKFRAYALLNHNGDVSAAARALRLQGYGVADGAGGTTSQAPSPAAASKRAGEREAGRGPQIVRLDELMKLQLPEPRWAVPGILCEGLNILAGKPKLGKSWLALNLAITIAAGGKALGDVQTTQGDVLYLALEDRFRRLQNRAGKVLAGLGVEASARLHFATEWPRQNQDGLGWIEDWVEKQRDARLVIVDVWARFRTPPKGNGSAYDQDYEQMSQVKQVADRHGVSFLVLHHCRKGQGGTPEDILDEISGTQGIAGTADGPMVLARVRGENEANLVIDGRDVGRQELALRFDDKTCCWNSLGPADKHTTSKVRQQVMDFFRRTGGAAVFPSELADQLNVNRDTLRKELSRMHADGVLRKIGQRYAWPLEDCLAEGEGAI